MKYLLFLFSATITELSSKELVKYNANNKGIVRITVCTMLIFGCHLVIFLHIGVHVAI